MFSGRVLPSGAIAVFFSFFFFQRLEFQVFEWQLRSESGQLVNKIIVSKTFKLPSFGDLSSFWSIRATQGNTYTPIAAASQYSRSMILVWNMKAFLENNNNVILNKLLRLRSKSRLTWLGSSPRQTVADHSIYGPRYMMKVCDLLVVPRPSNRVRSGSRHGIRVLLGVSALSSIVADLNLKD